MSKTEKNFTNNMHKFYIKTDFKKNIKKNMFCCSKVTPLAWFNLCPKTVKKRKTKQPAIKIKNKKKCKT